jgi:TRAP-type C4-dicarboxylate transport system permease small subunit
MNPAIGTWADRYVRFVDGLNGGLGRLVSLFLPVMVAAISFEVVARYAFSAPTRWAYDTALILFAWLGMLGGPLALRRDAHIRVDIFTARLTERARALVDLATLPLVGFFLILVVWKVGWAAIDAWQNGLRRPTDWAPPLFLFLAPAPIGAALLLLQAISNSIRAARLLNPGSPA